MLGMSLRWRISLAIALICLISVTLLGMALYYESDRMEIALVEQLVAEELDFLVQRHQEDAGYRPSAKANVEYYIGTHGREDPAWPAYLRRLSPGRYEVQLPGEDAERDVLVRDQNGWRYAVVYSIGPYEERERRFRRLVLWCLLVVMGIAMVLGHWSSGLITRQLSKLTSRVVGLIPGQPASLLAIPGQDAEVASLARAFDRWHALLLDMVRREQEFTANVSHELRTPLTAMRTSCELLMRDAGLSEKSASRVKQIQQAIDGMAAQVEALLFLARGQEPGQRECLNLRACAEDVLEQFHAEASSKGLVCRVAIEPDAVLQVNRQALVLVLTNLVRNAVRYTEVGYVEIAYAQQQLKVSDSGIGIPHERVSQIFERHFRGETSAAGLGLGLDIVRLVCDRCGWAISVESEVGRGTTFTLTVA